MIVSLKKVNGNRSNTIKKRLVWEPILNVCSTSYALEVSLKYTWNLFQSMMIFNKKVSIKEKYQTINIQKKKSEQIKDLTHILMVIIRASSSSEHLTILMVN